MLQIGTGIIPEAYEDLYFTCNLLADNISSESFEFLFSNTIKTFTSCFIFKKGSLNSTDILMEVLVNNELYPITFIIKENAQSSYQAERKVDIYHQRWHDKIGHVWSQQFQRMSIIYEDIPMFARAISKNFQCAPCLIWKLKQSPVENVDPEKNLPHTQFYFDLSGPIKPSLGGNINAAHLIQPTYSIMDVRLFEAERDTTNEVKNYIATFNSMWQHLGHMVNGIPNDNTR